ncbi:hypothetical protein GGS21DRAFT_499176 [Xylaria nigripes]|nr:hypothetical protein GGS21DRAFT_499176 [Xylaria nigripes]
MDPATTGQWTRVPHRSLLRRSRPVDLRVLPRPLLRRKYMPTKSRRNSREGSSSIGATNAIISFFEQKQAGTVPIKSTAVSSVRKELRIGLRPLTPPRIMSPVVTYDTSPSRLASSSAWVKTAPSSPSAGQNMARPNLPLHHAGCSLNGERRPPTPPERKKKHAEPLASTASSLINPSRRPRSATPPPKPVVRANTIVLSPQSRPVSSQRVINISSFEHLRFPDHPQPDSHIQRQISAAKTTTPPAGSINGESIRGTLTRGSSSSLSNNTFVSAASVLSQQADSPHRNNTGSPRPEVSRSRRPPSGPPALPSRPLVLRQNNPGPQIPLSSLTNAIVAGSLASARARPSTLGSLTPPPQKPTPHIRQTLRARQSKSDEDAAGHRPHHRKKPLGKLGSRNKHAHHEGARKRWREEITAHERQRYEGVWASNRGLLLDSPSAAAGGLQDINMTQLVANAVVRDIWARSRLPFDELAEVWDLVDTQGKGVLDKAEFVVGMWLIDQRLRGRKIPRKVSDSVWGSAKGVRVLGVKGKR